MVTLRQNMGQAVIIHVEWTVLTGYRSILSESKSILAKHKYSNVIIPPKQRAADIGTVLTTSRDLAPDVDDIDRYLVTNRYCLVDVNHVFRPIF